MVAPKGQTGREQRQAHTDAISTTKVIKLLNKQALGEAEMTAKQIQAAQILLRKTLPDLKVSEVEHSGNVTLTWQTPS